MPSRRTRRHRRGSVRTLVGEGASSNGSGTAEDVPGAADEYISHLVESAGSDLSGLRTVIDCANGAASLVAPDAFGRLGIPTRALFADGDGSRINEGCGALHPEVVRREAKHDDAIGLTFDGDADRVLVSDETGRFIDGEAILALLATRMRDHGELRGDAIVVTVMANQALREWCSSEGVGIVETPVGDRYVLEAM